MRGPLGTKSIKLPLKLLFVSRFGLIIVTSEPVSEISSNQKKYAKKLRGTLVSLIKSHFIELSYNISLRVSLVGVGFRVFEDSDLKGNIYFKLGYSHLIFFRMPENLKVNCYKHTKLSLERSPSFFLTAQTRSRIRKLRLPEPYKGKGVLNENETIVLKKGKRV